MAIKKWIGVAHVEPSFGGWCTVGAEDGNEQWVLDGLHKLEDAQRLASDLNELEAYREERRWRKIGEEWPEDDVMCQLYSTEHDQFEHGRFDAVFKSWLHVSEGWDVASVQTAWDGIVGYSFTHWRPAPTDVPKEEG